MSATPTHIGRYEVIRKLGSGGMGSVYLALDPVIRRQVAIKVVTTDIDSAEIRERFAREARSVGRLVHPNIVTIYDVGEQDGLAFIVMEYVHGETLAQVIAQRTPLSLPAKLAIGETVCAALAYAHKEGVVHRDVKPANVMVAADGTVKVLDFGIASLAHAAESSLTKAGTVFGTLNYISPEMIKGESVDHRADIFAVGSVLYELISGRQLFTGDLPTLLQQVLTGTHERLATVMPGLPPLLDQIIERSIATLPSARYQDLAEMARDVARCRAELQPASQDDAAAVLPLPDVAVVPPSSEPTVLSVPLVPLPGPTSGDDRTVIFSTATADVATEVPDFPDARLLVSRSPDPHQAGRTFPVSSRGITLGRSPECGVQVNDGGWSRQHARIECQDGEFVIRDLGSSNGTFVNGRRVRGDAPEPLFFGAAIDIGTTTLTFSYGRDTSLPDLTGLVVANRYRLERLLRESAKSAVYAASDETLPRNVAVKILSPELARYTGYREQFQREARTAAALQHPHVCQVLDSGLIRLAGPDGRSLETSFLCFELMAGGNLTSRLSASDPIALVDVRRWLEMLGSALAYAHQQGVVHGDLKPSAVVFDAAGNLYLTDFAIGQRALMEGQRPTMGAPAFMAPEQWEGAVATPASDQFSMAVLAYCILTGARPFEGQDNPEIRRKNFQRGAVPAHDEAAQNQRPLVPKAASQVLKRAFSMSAADRYPSIEAFTATLLKALHSGRVAGGEPLVFVSYDRELSGGWARFFADRLADKHAIHVFMDTAGLDRAGRFPPRLERAIEECDVFVCFLAGNSLKSKWVSEEVRLAHEFGKIMIPIFQESYVEPVELGDESPVKALISHQGIKLFDVSGHYVDHAVTDLARLVKGAMGDDEAKSP